jgi:Ca2+/Na+ antiporter
MHRKPKKPTNKNDMKRFLIFAVMAFALLMAMPGTAAEKADSAAIAAADSIRQAELTSTIQDIVRQEMNHYDGNSESVEDILAMMIPLSAIIMPFLVVCVVVAIAFWHTTRRRRMKYSIVEKAIENHYQLPAYVFQEQSKPMSKTTTLRSACTIMAVGIGVSLFFFLENETEVAALCSMIFLIGLGKLVVYLVERKNNKKEENEENEEKQEETQTLAANDDNAFKD